MLQKSCPHATNGDTTSGDTSSKSSDTTSTSQNSGTGGGQNPAPKGQKPLKGKGKATKGNKCCDHTHLFSIQCTDPVVAFAVDSKGEVGVTYVWHMCDACLTLVWRECLFSYNHTYKTCVYVHSYTQVIILHKSNTLTYHDAHGTCFRTLSVAWKKIFPELGIFAYFPNVTNLSIDHYGNMFVSYTECAMLRYNSSKIY